MKYLGYFKDTKTLPDSVQPGSTVKIPKGTRIFSTKIGKYIEAKRTYSIKVFHLGCGCSVPWSHFENYYMNDWEGKDDELLELLDEWEKQGGEYNMVPVENPKIIWPGEKGYWKIVDINDILSLTS